MATATMTTVAGAFSTQGAAERAVRDLRAAGFRDDEIGLVGKAEAGQIETTTATGHTMAEEGAAAGAVAGAGIGVAVGFGVLAGVIPVIGPAIAVGTLGTLAANAVAGAAVAGLVGGLIGAGIPEEDAQYFEGEVKAGRYLITVTTDGRGAEARAILYRNGGYDRTSPAPVM